MVNPIKVSKRDNGFYYVFDGQHTINALKKLNNDKNVSVECKVYEFKGMSDDQRRKIEAALFSEQNGFSSAVLTIDKLKAKYISGDKDIIKFKNLTESTGLTMDFTRANIKGKINCCAEAFKAFKQLPTNLYVEMLTAIRDTWGGERESLKAEIIGGTALLYSEYGSQINPKTFAKQLSKVSPRIIIRNANISTESGKKKYADEILKVYNKGLKTKRLV